MIGQLECLRHVIGGGLRGFVSTARSHWRQKWADFYLFQINDQIERRTTMLRVNKVGSWEVPAKVIQSPIDYLHFSW